MPDRSIFITGASSGIGLATALRLRSVGFRVYAGVLPGEDIAALTQQNSEGIIVVPMDITRPESVSAAYDTVKRGVGETGLYGLFNNAGIALSGPLEFMPMEVLQNQFDVNVMGHVRVTQQFIPLLRPAKGRIVNTVSILGRVATAFGGPYSMSKFAMEGFTDALRQEMHQFDVNVVAIEPGTISTPIWKKARDNAEELMSELPPQAQQLYGKDYQVFVETTKRQQARGISPDEVAKAVTHAFTAPRPRTRYVVGSDAKLLNYARIILPDRLLDFMMRKLYPTREE